MIKLKQPQVLLIENYPEKTILRCSQCEKSCFFQITIEQIEYLNSPGRFQVTKKLVAYYDSPICNTYIIDNLEVVPTPISITDPKRKHSCPNCDKIGYIWDSFGKCTRCSLCKTTGKITTEELFEI